MREKNPFTGAPHSEDVRTSQRLPFEHHHLATRLPAPGLQEEETSSHTVTAHSLAIVFLRGQQLPGPDYGNHVTQHPLQHEAMKDEDEHEN